MWPAGAIKGFDSKPNQLVIHSQNVERGRTQENLHFACRYTRKDQRLEGDPERKAPIRVASCKLGLLYPHNYEQAQTSWSDLFTSLKQHVNPGLLPKPEYVDLFTQNWTYKLILKIALLLAKSKKQTHREEKTQPEEKRSSVQKIQGERRRR